MNIIKRIALVITLIVFTSSSALVYAKIKRTLLVFDMSKTQLMPNNFRTSSDALPKNLEVKTYGLRELHIAGSQQYSKDGLKHALALLPTKSVVLIDLRRESHGFLNDSAVSWYGPQNAANADKSENKIKASESRLLSRLRHAKFRPVYEIKQKTKDAFIDKASRHMVKVDEVISEKQLAKEYGVQYKRYYVKDFHAADDATVDRFVAFAKTVPNNVWLYFHCRAGKGRTTQFMAMYDMMKNAKNVSYDDIIARQYAIGGSDLNKLPEKTSFKYNIHFNRRHFLRSFYQYAKNNDDNFATTWSEWKKNNLV